MSFVIAFIINTVDSQLASFSLVHDRFVLSCDGYYYMDGVSWLKLDPN